MRGSLITFAQLQVAMTPAVGWVAARRGGRDGSFLGALMTLPVAGIAVAGTAAGGDALRWLVNGMYPVMSVGALAYALALARPPVARATGRSGTRLATERSG